MRRLREWLDAFALGILWAASFVAAVGCLVALLAALVAIPVAAAVIGWQAGLALGGLL